MCRLEPTQPDSSGTRVAVTFRGTPPTVSVCDQNDRKSAQTKSSFENIILAPTAEILVQVVLSCVDLTMSF